MSTHNMFLLGTEENYPIIIIKYSLTIPLFLQYLRWNLILMHLRM